MMAHFMHQVFFWHEAENYSFIETLLGNKCKLFYFTFDTEPKLVSTRPRDERTIAIMDNKDNAVFIYRVSSNVYHFDKFEFETKTVSRALKFESGFSNLYGPAYPLNDKEFLLRFDDGTHGFEPWVYNIETHQFEILDDIRKGFLSSSISDIANHPITGEVYFTATRTEGDRQLFKIVNQSVSTENIQYGENYYFTINPIPTSDFIVLDRDFDNINIIGIEGKVILSLSDYHKGDFINLSDIPNGIYFLLGTKNGQLLRPKSLIVSK
ncbi:MAG: hypothetical protein IPN86_17880 [Saprospiraceae bacterium]|nr:hypothetical protein [Saprospiraceae bacterium]